NEIPQRIGDTPSELICQPPAYAARIVPPISPPTATVVIGTVASVAPAGMKTLAGVWASARSLATLITAPPAGAGMFSVTRRCLGVSPTECHGAADHLC